MEEVKRRSLADFIKRRLTTLSEGECDSTITDDRETFFSAHTGVPVLV